MSGNATLSENPSGYVEKELKPLVRETPSFCQDTTDFLNKLAAHGDVKPGTLLVTMDGASLYTNKFIKALQASLEQAGHPEQEAINKLIHFILTHNVFAFNKYIYIQKQGTAMDTKFAPQYANLYMYHLKPDFINTHDRRPDLHTRNIDDTSMLWPLLSASSPFNGEEALKNTSVRE